MENFICVQCGAQFAESAEPPACCPICEDERQFVRHSGQEWTTLKQLQTHHRNRLDEETPRLLGIGTEPQFAIGQRALLLQSPGGNLLWDCITLLDDQTATEIDSRGGIRAIAVSHPHFYSGMIEWAERFDAPIFLHAADRQWVMRGGAARSHIQFWEEMTLPLWDGLTLINCGGHFDGGTVLHWPAGGNGTCALLTGDIIQVVPDRRVRKLHAQLSQPDSAEPGCGSSYFGKSCTVPIRADLRCVVESECPFGCKRCSCAISRTLPEVDRSLGEYFCSPSARTTRIANHSRRTTGPWLQHARSRTGQFIDDSRQCDGCRLAH